MVKKFKKVLVANRGEIAIRIIRACSELGIRSVAIYSEEDKNSLFRTKADESYLVGKNKGPIDAYLDMDEIIKLALKKGIDAIHPGYGFLAENTEFAKKCEDAGITFIGPKYTMMEQFGDKIKSKIVANLVGVPTIPGVDKAVRSENEAKEFAAVSGYPIILKASAGGGGRGMRVVHDEDSLMEEFHSAQSEARKAFGNDDIFIEKYLEKPKHIEVQIVGDNYGNIVHLYERDCSIQRRHQKVVEFTPAFGISDEKRKAICDDAVKIAESIDYCSVGTVEFLLDSSGEHYFIEVNPRIQVEHTVTEMVTGIDIVQTQILVAEGYALDSPEIGINSQDDIVTRGFAIQSRVTTEDPLNNFAPDTGIIDTYRTGSGFGIRLDGGSGFTGANISPYYDSLLVKVTSYSNTFKDAARKATRALRETNIRGVKTNVPLLINILNNEEFLSGECNTGFLKSHPELFDINIKSDIELKVLNYIGNKVVNETNGEKPDFDIPRIPKVDRPEVQRGTKQIFDEEGADGLVKWIEDQEKLLITDTTMRDAHQSLLATRVRTTDMLSIGKATSVYGNDLFSLEMWGGATFDVAYRYLNEDPWDRLKRLRDKIPNILFQMLFRGSNAVGYKNYPDNAVREMVKKSADYGIDVFRVFDSLNWLESMKVAIDEVLKQGKIAEGCLCYTGDILDESRTKYNLDYYVRMAKEIEKTGAQILGIKDMSSLLKPKAADKLVRALKEEISIPIHLHTHDTSGNGVATVLMAALAGVDIVDTAFNSMSGLTSQPALNSVVAALQHTERDTGLDINELEEISEYWESVRPYYAQFESGLKSGSASIYEYEMPGGQFSNFKTQVDSFGLGSKFDEVRNMYKEVNEMLGDIIKVTPSSKVVGDMAIFMVQNGLTQDNILEKGKNLAYPDSAISYFEGMMGQPEGGFPKGLQKIVLKDIEPITVRPGELLPAVDLEKEREYLETKYEREFDDTEVLSYVMYPKVFEDYLDKIKKEGDFWRMNSHVFFYGMREGEIAEVHIDEGKIMIVKLLEVGNVDDEGNRVLLFEVNDSTRAIKIKDEKSNIGSSSVMKQFIDPGNPNEIGSSIPGTVMKILVEEGEEVTENQTVAVIEAMKMETNIAASVDGVVKFIAVEEGQIVEGEELIMRLE